MANLSLSRSLVIERSADELYDMISDITRMGEWSPVCKSCSWHDGANLRVGAWFTGHNETPDRIWETESEVVSADRGREFAFIVGGVRTRWGYTFEPVEGGTEVTESWEFLPGGITFFVERFGDDAATQIADRAETAREGMTTTLAAIKAIAERR